MTAEVDPCVFTSECNELGVCCQNPLNYEGYKPLQQISPTGTCCIYAGDCRSGICIGQVCRDPVDSERLHEDHARKGYQIAIICATFLLAGMVATLCIMKTCGTGTSEYPVDVVIHDHDSEVEMPDKINENPSIEFQFSMNMKVVNNLGRSSPEKSNEKQSYPKAKDLVKSVKVKSKKKQPPQVSEPKTEKNVPDIDIVELDLDLDDLE